MTIFASARIIENTTEIWRLECAFCGEQWTEMAEYEVCALPCPHCGQWQGAPHVSAPTRMIEADGNYDETDPTVSEDREWA